MAEGSGHVWVPLQRSAIWPWIQCSAWRQCMSVPLKLQCKFALLVQPPPPKSCMLLHSMT